MIIMIINYTCIGKALEITGSMHKSNLNAIVNQSS